MNARTVMVFAWIALLAVLATGCGNGSAGTGAGSDENQARLEIKGSPGTEFTGSCAVGDAKPVKFGGETPKVFTYDLRGRQLECEVSSKEDLEVQLAVGQNTRSSQSISGGTLHLSYRDGGISIDTSTASGSGAGEGSSSSRGSSHTETNTRGSDSGSGGSVIEKSEAVSGFDAVELSGVGKLYIQQTGHESLSIEAEKSVIPKLSARVVDGRLILGQEPDSALHTTAPIIYHLTVKDLRSLKVLGTANAQAKGIQTDRLAVSIGGAGRVSIVGKAAEQEVDISGTGVYLAKNLESKEVGINVSGAGSAAVNAQEKLDVEVSGVGSVEYVGDPTVQQNVSGAGRVTKL